MQKRKTRDMSNGIDSAGTWTPHQFALDMGWDATCVEATARLGVSETDASGLTVAQQETLVAWCKAQAA